MQSPKRLKATMTVLSGLQVLLDQSLRVALSSFLTCRGKGTLVDRCRRLEEASWTYIYREDLPDLASLSPLDKGLADWGGAGG